MIFHQGNITKVIYQRIFVIIAKTHLYNRFALGIGAASFWSAAEKDIAESPTASPERPKERRQVTETLRLQGFEELRN